MPIYDIQASDGKIYSVQAPEGTPEEKLFSLVSEQMTIRKTLPDGRILEFPNGTDKAIIDATVKRIQENNSIHSSTTYNETPNSYTPTAIPAKTMGFDTVLLTLVAAAVGFGFAFFCERKITTRLLS